MATVAAIAIIAGLIRFVGWRVQVSEAKAAQSEMRSLYDFNPGNIISDGAFFNGNALSERQVQTILDQQGATCQCSGDHADALLEARLVPCIAQFSAQILWNKGFAVARLAIACFAVA